MIEPPSTRPGRGLATALLRQVFAAVPGAFAFRLWDGTEVRFGGSPPDFTVVIHDRAAFVRLMRAPTPGRFAEAYVESAIDIEGDLFATMAVANALEELRLPLARRLRFLLRVWRG